MPSIPTIVNKVLTSPAPILFVDTCSLIDIASGSKRLRKHQDLCDALSICAGANENLPKYYIIKASLVEKEYQDNVDSGVAEIHSFISKIIEDTDRLNADGKLLGFGPIHPGPDLKLPEELRKVSDKLLTTSITIDHHDDHQLAACSWAVKKLRPSKQGKFKDAQIMLECLEVAKALRSRGFGLPVVFISSNTADFSIEKGSSVLHTDIAGIFDHVGLIYAHCWQRAYSFLNL